jgi:histidinol-phosphate phosphatase family protein
MKIDAVFLDRDGVINAQEGNEDIYRLEDFRLIENSDKAIRLFNENGIKTVVVTNQPVVAKGFCTEEHVRSFNKQIASVLMEKRAVVDAFYFCPHYPKSGFPGENLKYKIECECRKPKIGMLLEARKKFGMDFSKCFLIGDRTADIKTGENAGCKTILVKTGSGGSDGKYSVEPDYVCSDLFQAAKLIVGLKKI